MKKLIAIFAVVLAARLFVTGNEKQMIGELLDQWHLAAAEAREDIYFGLLADDAVFIGTDAGERWNKKEFMEWAWPYFQRASAWVFRAEKREICISSGGNFAWFDELLYSKSYWRCRGSGVLEKIDGKWLIRQYVLSFTIPNDKVSEIMPFIVRDRQD
jgi:hypothetical protein